MSKYAQLLFAAISLITLPGGAMAATCSCAGTPLLTSIDTSAREKGQLFLTYSTEFHQISDLVNGRRDVTDEPDRDRHSLSQVLSASYRDYGPLGGLCAGLLGRAQPQDRLQLYR